METMKEIVERVRRKHNLRRDSLDADINRLEERLKQSFSSDLARAKVLDELSCRLKERHLWRPE
jgi:hypothetical protein